MELSKIQTLSLMLEREKQNRDTLQSDNKKHSAAEIAKTEATIRKLEEQLHQMCGEVG